MIFRSVCSGIEAASVAWEPLGWRADAFAEIDKFPSAVLAHRYPNTPNLGDMTKFKDWPDEQFDVLVGGTPCQDLSVAGKRAGLAGVRSGLFHDFVAIAKRYKPPYIVWENVPGALSTNEGKDFQVVMDAFTQIGYACDVDILDAQCFGLAQRRRRIFIVCVRLDGLLQKKTPTSARIAGELLLQPLRDTWAAILQAWSPDKSLSSYESPIERSADFALRRIELLDAALDGSACTKLLNALGATQAQSTAALPRSASTSRRRNEKPTGASRTVIGGYPSWSMGAASGDKSTATSWNNILGALSDQKNGSTTKTLTEATIASEICTFARQTLNTAQSITDLKGCSGPHPWSADYWHLGSLLLTTLEAVTVYARHATEDLFGDASLRNNWWDYIDEARKLADQSQRNFGTWRSASEVFSLQDSLQGNPPPRREAREGIAPTISARTKLTNPDNRCNPQPGDPSHPLASQGRPPTLAFSTKDYGNDCMEDVSPTMRAMNHTESHANAGGQIGIVQQWRVRRLTPLECMRLQGFPEIRNRVTINVCYDHQKSHAGAESQSRKSQPNADPATDKSSVSRAKTATPHSTAKQVDGERRAVLNVRLRYGILEARLLNPEKSPSSASIAEDQSWCRLPTPNDDFVRLVVRTLTCAANAQLLGKVELLESGNCSIRRQSGALPFTLCGDAIVASAENVKDAIATANELLTFITSQGGRSSQSSEQDWQTLFSCVAAAIVGCIPRQTRPANSFALEVETHEGYLDIDFRGKPPADGPIYKALGNSMACNVMAWLGRRIQMVEDIVSGEKDAA